MTGQQHPATTAAAPPQLPPVRRQVVVNATPERAFTAWTDQLGSWWPFPSHSVGGVGATASFVDGRLVEVAPDGSRHVWGTVTRWEPGRRLTMTWHPGSDEDVATTVDVQFAPLTGPQTLVTLTHTGWERRPDLAAARENYRTGWVRVVGRYADALSTVPTPAQPDQRTWLVLEHTVWDPGTTSVFTDPRFPEHLAFLQRVDGRGWLVAAGNLPDSPGSGMTVLRVPDAHVAEAVAAAQDDDRSVADALFGVRVRVWSVALPAAN